MKTMTKIWLQIITALLILLWVYAASSKLLDFNMFKIQMHRQLLPAFVKSSAAYLLPPVEILTAVLLMIKRFQLAGLYLSLVMLFAFTIYIGLAVFKYFDNVPCSCGGILTRMPWEAHFVFNIFFLLLSAVGVFMIYRERRPEN